MLYNESYAQPRPLLRNPEPAADGRATPVRRGRRAARRRPRRRPPRRPASSPRRSLPVNRRSRVTGSGLGLAKLAKLSLFAKEHFANFWRARSRLYQNEILQENMRLTAFFKLYKICILLQRCNLNIFFARIGRTILPENSKRSGRLSATNKKSIVA